TSGMLVDSDIWADGLTYDEGLFVDYTDTDWCFRVRAKGYCLVVVLAVTMPHSLSDAPPIRAFNVNLLRYSPLRRYYYFRNTVYFVKKKYVSRPWRRRLLAGLAVRLITNIFIDDRRLRGLAMSMRGALDGLRGRMGKLD